MTAISYDHHAIISLATIVMGLLMGRKSPPLASVLGRVSGG